MVFLKRDDHIVSVGRQTVKDQREQKVKMLDVIHHQADRPSEVFLEIIMKPSDMAHLSIAQRIIIFIAVLCISLGIIFWAIGAGPVLPFMGVEVLLLYMAYRFGVRHGRKTETLSLSKNELIVRKAGFGKKSRSHPLATLLEPSRSGVKSRPVYAAVAAVQRRLR